MTSNFFSMLFRQRYIRRWSLMRSAFPETLAEHSGITAILAHALAVIRRDVFGNPADPDKAAAAALFHDCSEIITGDMPTPVKYGSRELRDAYKAAESAARSSLLGMLPEKLRPAYAGFFGGSGESDLVKAADTLAAYIKCVEEVSSGNRDFAVAERQTLEKLKALDMPEVDWFLEYFIKGFSLTLDEQG